jgi:hypothetical protein
MNTSAIQIFQLLGLLRPHYELGSLSTIAGFASHLLNFSIPQALYEQSIREPEQFWRTQALSALHWRAPFSRVSDCDLSSGKISWFLDGKLNVAGA